MIALEFYELVELNMMILWILLINLLCITLKHLLSTFQCLLKGTIMEGHYINSTIFT